MRPSGRCSGAASSSSAGRARTESDGRYEIDGVPVGRRRVVVTHRSLAMPTHADVLIVEGDNVCDIAIRATTLRGIVLDERGHPIEGALVSAMPETADADTTAAGMDEAVVILGGLFGGGESKSAVRSDATGRFELRGVREGVRLRVRAWCGSTSRVPCRPMRCRRPACARDSRSGSLRQGAST